MIKKVVWKYPVSIMDYFSLKIPFGGEILYFGLQKALPMLWVLVDPSKELIERKFRLARTGHDIVEKGLKYIGTVNVIKGTFIFHLFELVKK